MSEHSAFPWSGLEEAAEVALQEARIFDVGSYGWLSADDADPEFIGHAMWQVSQPNLELSALTGSYPVRRRPDFIDGEVLTLGEDFCGLMQASRLSIGLTLLWKAKEISNLLSESAFFWLYYTDAYLKLDIASDRLRALIIMTCTGLTTERYKSLDRKNGRYITPFCELTSLLLARGVPTDPLQTAIAKLPEFASRIHQYRIGRNAIVHEVATRTGVTTRESVKQLQQQYDDEQIHGFKGHEFDYSDLQEVIKGHDERRMNEINVAVNSLIDWYRLLIDTSNEVFQVDHAVRAASGALV